MNVYYSYHYSYLCNWSSWCERALIVIFLLYIISVLVKKYSAILKYICLSCISDDTCWNADHKWIKWAMLFHGSKHLCTDSQGSVLTAELGSRAKHIISNIWGSNIKYFRHLEVFRTKKKQANHAVVFQLNREFIGLLVIVSLKVGIARVRCFSMVWRLIFSQHIWENNRVEKRGWN